jgi:hypothetical protein
MRDKTEVAAVANMTGKEIEQTIGIQIRNGQTSQAVKKTINWVLGNQNKVATMQHKYAEDKK